MDTAREIGPYSWTTNGNNYVQDGVYVKTGAINKRYIGTVYIQSGVSNNNTISRHVWNMYNRIDVLINPTTAGVINWTYNSTTWRPLGGGGVSNPIDFVVGQDEDLIDITIGCLMSVPTTSCFALLSLYCNGVQVADNGTRSNTPGQNQLYVNYQFRPYIQLGAIGRFYFDVYEARAGTGTYSGFGGFGNTSYFGGMFARWRC